jgi:hypothetical protein
VKRREGNLFAQFVGDADVALVIPTNGELDKLRYAIMGAGVALQAAQTWPESKRQLGKLIDTCGNHCFVLPVTRQPREWTVTFPTKNRWKEKSSLPLIEQSAHELLGLTDTYGWSRVFLPRVGCGHGGLNWLRDVRPILKDILDDRFTVVYDERYEPIKATPKSRKPVSNRMKVKK